MIKLEMFKGIAPRFAPQALPERAAQVAENCYFGSGALRPHNGLLASGVTTVSGAKTIFLYTRSTNTWLSYTVDTDIVRSPVAKDAYGRIYMADGTKPVMKVIGSATLFDLGVPAPDVAGMTLSVDSSGRDPDPPVATSAETRYYALTYVSAYDEESPPSSPKGPYTVYPGDEVDISSIPTGPTSGTNNVATKRLYRTNTGSDSTEYQMVASLSLATTTHTDALENTQLGVILPSITWDSPPSSLRGLRVHPSGFLVGYSGKTVYCSELYLPHAWPYSYPVNTEAIVGIEIFGNSILVMTNDCPHILSGQTPEQMVVEKIELGMACVSKRGAVDMGDVIIYPGVEGLIGIGVGNAPKLLTESILTRREWASYNPSSLIASQWDNKYVGFCEAVGGDIGFIYDPTNNDLSTFSLGMAEAVYYDPPTGNLYVKMEGEAAVRLFNAGSPLTYTWKSRVYRLAKPTSFAAGQVFADAYPLTVKVYADGLLYHTQTVTSESPFRLPSVGMYSKWEAEIIGDVSVNCVFLAETVKELKQSS